MKIRNIFAQSLYFILSLSFFVGSIVFALRGQESYVAFAEEKDRLTLLIDAGHGGLDGGTSSKTGLKESEVNLSVALKLAKLCDFCGVKYALTRDTEDISYGDEAESTSQKKVYDTKMRVALANSFKNCILMSIHQNSYPSSSPKGPQVFFGKVEGSEDFGILMQETINSALSPSNSRIATKVSSDIYLMDKVACPAILLECGFLSNPEEEALLSTEDYRLKIALTILSAYTNSL